MKLIVFQFQLKLEFTKNVCFYQLEVGYISQNNYSIPFTMSRPVYSYKRETIEIALCTSKFLICLAKKVYFF